ncbi:MAG: histidine kinase [Gemmatimonadaceae bacterium]|nr:histidine kinase [Chitinophagaceae bacterium]
MKKLTRLYCLVPVLLLTLACAGQNVAFHHLNRTNGLSDNTVRSIVIDKNGFLWIGTAEGLNVFDGYGVTSFLKEKYPALSSNNIVHLTCDKNNRVWAGSPAGVTWVDENRNFTRILLNDSIERFACASIFETKSHGIVLYTDKGQYSANKEGKWEKLNWLPEYISFKYFLDAENFDDDKIIFTTDSIVTIIDYKNKSVFFELPIKSAVSACRVNDVQIAVGIHMGMVKKINIRNGNVDNEYRITNELIGRSINTNLSEVRRASNGDLIVATDFAGLVTIDKMDRITRHTHDPLDPGTLSSNNTFRAFAGENGEVVVGTGLAGVNISNIYNKQAGYLRVFSDLQGNLFDNYVSHMVEGRDGDIWIGAYDRLIRWNKKTNKSEFYFYYHESKASGLKSLQLRSLAFDRRDRLWVSAIDAGVGIFDEKKKTFSRLIPDSNAGKAEKSDFIFSLLASSDGKIWASTAQGVFSIDPETMKTRGYGDHPLLKTFEGKRVIAMHEDKNLKMWFSVQGSGLYCYDRAMQTLILYGVKQGLGGTSAPALMAAANGDLYAATNTGFSIIYPNGKLKTFNKNNGLRYGHCEAILEDSSGNIWISNTKCLVKYNPRTGKMQFFDENAGLSNEGFRPTCALIAKDGDMVWGTLKGINFFKPAELINNPSQIRVVVSGAHLVDSVVRFAGDRSLRLAWSRNTVIFYFTAINLQGSANILYEYMLEGYDKEWQRGVDLRQARYSSLPTGNYKFLLRATSDQINWISSANEVNIRIVPPLWQRWWFVLAVLLLLTASVFLFVRSRTRKLRRQREEIETEQAINYFASSMSYQQSVEMILWDVVKNCIGKLHFEDCVIYLMHDESKMLVQKAAHGPKNPRNYEIEHPIEIPVGKGIVGSVAASGKPELIADTSLDKRYIVDDERRCSEISVPIISDGKVLGVIDCEHSRRNFFTQRHLSILTTIASLVANKIVRTMAEEEKVSAERILSDTRQKMAEAEMQALRAQMNPHFIFNCLNSINRYIVKSDQATASLYLTRFAKLIRLILDNSNSKNVILSNELEALKLYIEMEGLRFDKKFIYTIKVDNNVNTDSVEVPPLIMQPYVENAIWHGLLHKESGGRLDILISMASENMLQCIIEDDGVGRQKAQELKSKSATTRKSLGMKLTEGRISLLNKHAELNASVDIIDVVNPAGNAGGTRVILMIPC